MKNKKQLKMMLQFTLSPRYRWLQSVKTTIFMVLPFILVLFLITDTNAFANREKKYSFKNSILRQKYKINKKIGNSEKKEGREVIVRLKKQPLRRFNNKTRRKIKKSLRELKEETRLNQNSFVNYLEHDRTTSRNSKRKRIRRFWLSNCIAMTVTEEELQEIANHPDVEEIVDNIVLSIPPINPNGSEEDSAGSLDLWNHDLIGMDKIKEMGLDGSNIKVGHLDTGIDLDNSELTGKLGAWAEFGPDGEKIDSLPHDDHDQGHGTHSASIIAGNTIGVAPGVTLISALVLNQGYGTITQALAGMEWVMDPDGNPETDDGAQIVNISWGASGTVDILNEAVKNMIAADVLPICAIGNSGYGSTVSPGNTPDAIGVGAVNCENSIVSFSAGGEVYWGNLSVTKPNVVAPGVDIPGVGLNGVYQTMSGTSFAAPHVAGVAALLLEYNPGLTLTQMKQFLYNSSLDNGYPGIDTYYGHGSIDASSALNFLMTYNHRFGAKDVIIKHSLSVPGYNIHQFKSYFSDGQQILAAEHGETGFAYPDTDTIGLSDVTGDGFADLVVKETTQIGSETYLHSFLVYPSGESKGLPEYPESWFSLTSDSPDAHEVIGLSDVNGDKRSDIVYVEKEEIGYSTKYVFRVLLAQGDRTFVASSQPWYEDSIASYYLINFHLGDVNGDGRGDIVSEIKSSYSDYAPISYDVALSAGTKFSPFKTGLATYSHYPIGDSKLQYVTDVNADGYDDLVFISENRTASATTVPVYISRSSGSYYYSFSIPQTWGQIPMKENSRIIGVADIDNDGASDLLVKEDTGSSRSVYVWQSNKINGFSKTMVSPWFEIETSDLPYNAETQVIGIGDLGLGNWKTN